MILQLIQIFVTSITTVVAVGGLLWAFFKFGSSKVIDEFLKRHYKKWELETEKPYKQEQKRYEAGIDENSSQASTRYALLHSKRAEATEKIYNSSRLLTSAFDHYMIIVKSTANIESPETRKERHEFKRAVDKLLDETSKATQTYLLYLNKSTLEIIANFVNYVWRLSALESSSENVPLLEIENTAKERLQAMQDHFKVLLDGDK